MPALTFTPFVGSETMSVGLLLLLLLLLLDFSVDVDMIYDVIACCCMV